jgi:hypothetical protein
MMRESKAMRAVTVFLALAVLTTAVNTVARASGVAIDEEKLKAEVKSQIVERLFNDITSSAEEEVKDITYFRELLRDYEFLGVNMGDVNFSQKALEIYNSYQEAKDEGKVREYLGGQFSGLLLSAMDKESQEIVGDLQGLYSEAKANVQGILDVSRQLEQDPDADVTDLIKKYGLKGNWVEKFETFEVNYNVAKDRLGKYGDYYDMFKIVAGGVSSKHPGAKISALFQLGAQFGGKIPVLGKFVELYAKVGQEMLNAVGRLSEKLRARQGYCLGTGTTGHIESMFEDKRNVVFSKKFTNVLQACPLELVGVYKDIYFDVDAPRNLYFWVGDGFVVGNQKCRGGDDLRAMIVWLRRHGYVEKAKDVKFLARAYNIGLGFLERKERVGELARDMQGEIRRIGSGLWRCKDSEEKGKFLLDEGRMNPIMKALDMDPGLVVDFPVTEELVDRIIEDRIIKDRVNLWDSCEDVKLHLQGLVVLTISGEVVDKAGEGGTTEYDVLIVPERNVLANCSEFKTERRKFYMTLHKEKSEIFVVNLNANDGERESKEVAIAVDGDKNAYTCTIYMEKPEKEIEEVSVSPSSVILRIGEEKGFNATAHFSDKTTQPVTRLATWSGGVGGFFTAKAPGDFGISAEYMNKKGSAAIKVPDFKMTIAPGRSPPVKTGENPITFSAQVVYDDGFTQDITYNAEWTGGRENVFYPPSDIEEESTTMGMTAAFGGKSVTVDIEVIKEEEEPESTVAELTPEDLARINQVLRRLDDLLSSLYLLQFAFDGEYDAFMSTVDVAASGATHQDPCKTPRFYYAGAKGILEEARSHLAEIEGLAAMLPSASPPPSELVDAQVRVSQGVGGARSQVSGMKGRFGAMTSKLKRLGCDPREVEREAEEETGGRSGESGERTVKHDERHQEQDRPYPVGGCCGAGVATCGVLPGAMILARAFRKRRKNRMYDADTD